MQASDLTRNTLPLSNPQAVSSVVDHSDEDNDPLIATDGVKAKEATSTTLRQSGTMTLTGKRPGHDYGNEAFENIALATLLLNEVLETISQPNLENILYIFRQVLEEATPGHAFHSDVSRSLAVALGLKYICTEDQKTLSELINLGERIEEINSAASASNLITEDDELCDMFALGKVAWDELMNSISPATIDTIIFLIQQFLEEISPQDANRASGLATLAYTTYLQFHRSEIPSDFTTVISMLQAVESEGWGGRDPRIANSLKLIQVTVSAPGEHGKRTTTGGLFREPSVPRQAAKIDLTPRPTSDDVSMLKWGIGDLENSIEMLRLGLTEISLNSPNYSAGLNNLANGLELRFERHGDVNDLNQSVSLNRQALELRPFPNPLRSYSLNNLANGLSARFLQQGNPQDLNESISLHREALELQHSPHPDRSISLNNLANRLLARFEQAGNPRDLNESISFHRQVLELRPSPHPLRSGSLNNLANGLSIRFEQDGNHQDLNESICLHREALELRPFPHFLRSSSFNNLGNALFTRFEQCGDPQDLDDSISLHMQARQLRPSSHPLRSSSLNNLANGLFTRFEQRGNVRDLEDSILLARQALALRPSGHPDRSISLNNLANGLSAQFKQRGDVLDLDESISLHRQSLELRPLGHPDRSGSLNNLANGLFTLFEHQGNPQDLDESISLHKQALELLLFAHPKRLSLFNNLATGLFKRFKLRGNAQDLDESISLHRQVLELRPSGHPDRYGSLNNLACGLLIRFEQYGDSQDLDESVSLYREALELHPSPHPCHSESLSNIANGLLARFEHRGSTQDLDESIFFYSQALELQPTLHPSRFSLLYNLANGLQTRFNQRGNLQDLDDSISLYRRALDLLPLSHPDRLDILQSLANRLHIRFIRGGRASDLEESFRLVNECIQLLPADHPSRPTSLASLSALHRFAYDRDPLKTNHLDRALELLLDAANSVSASPSQRYQYARVCALDANKHDHASALQAYDLAVSLMPQSVALGLDIQSRQDRLTKNTDGLAGQAARCAIDLGDLSKAVEFLETGRSVFWSQFLSLRSPLDELEGVSPRLAADLRSISRQLEEGSHRNQINGALSNREKLTLEAEANHYTKLAREWDGKVGDVRQLESFQDFLRPRRFSALQAAAGDGPIIYLVANDKTSDCLVITASSICHIPLPELGFAALSALVHFIKVAASGDRVSRSVVDGIMNNLPDELPVSNALRQCMEGVDRGMRPERIVSDHFPSDVIFTVVLQMLWDRAVRPIINVLGLKKRSQNPPRLTWCPTGLFTFLPVHAAGCYHESLGNIDCTSDYFISSYTPSIEALLTPDLPSAKSFQMMVIIQSRTLPSTREELRRIENHVSNSVLTKFGIPEAPTTMESVATHLSAASIVHFACHGKQDSANPLQSGLEIEGERLTIARIMRESLPNGSLAFLSACETAMGDEKIPDEAMNIASSLLFTGFRKVVATMWRMWDEDGPVIADAFYRELFTGPDGNRIEIPDTSKSAQALWTAVKELRSKGVEFRRWVPFIHMGK